MHLGRVMRREAVVTADQPTTDHPGTKQSLAPEDFSGMRHRVVHGDHFLAGLEALLDDEGFLLRHSLIEPVLPVFVTTSVADEDAVGASSLAIRPGDLEHELGSVRVTQVEQVVEALDRVPSDVEGELVFAEGDEARVGQESVHDLVMLVSQLLAEVVLVKPEDGEPGLVPEMSELGNHPNLASLSSVDQLGELARRLEDRELPPDGADSRAAVEDAGLVDGDLVELGSRDDIRLATDALEVLDKPGHGRYVRSTPVVRDDEENRALLEEPVPAPLPLVGVKAVRVVDVNQVGETTRHLIVFRSNEQVAVDVHVRSANRPLGDRLFATLRVQVAGAKARGVLTENHSSHESVLDRLVLANELVTGALPSSDRLQVVLHALTAVFSRLGGNPNPAEALPSGGSCRGARRASPSPCRVPR